MMGTVMVLICWDLKARCYDQLRCENGKNSSNEDDVIWEDVAPRKGDIDDYEEEDDDDVYWTIGAVLAVAAVIGIGLFAWGRSKRRV